MNKQDFALAWFIPPVPLDWSNLIVSGVRRVMLGYQLATTKPDVLSRLSGLGRHIVVRLEEQNTQPPAEIAHTMNDIRHILPVDAFLLPTEPDTGCDMTYPSPDWCQDRAYASLPRIDALIQAIKGLGMTVVSPAMTWPPDVISEDGIPQPGRVTWREIVGPTYDKADGVASHCGYVLGWTPAGGDAVQRQNNIDRFKLGLKRAVEEWHQPLWIEEGTFPTDNDVLQMRCAIEQCDIIMASRCNDRVKLYSPFVSAGDPRDGEAWPVKYLLKDPACYALLGSWMAS